MTKIFFQDILKGLGLCKERVLDEYGNEEECVQLEQRLQVLKTKMQGEKSTGTQYIRTFNLFLVRPTHDSLCFVLMDVFLFDYKILILLCPLSSFG